MKKIFFNSFLILLVFGCQSNQEILPTYNTVPEVENTSLSLDKLHQIEQKLGIEEYTDVFSTKKLSELDAFYTNLSEKMQSLDLENNYIGIFQHNLIVAMVINHGLADELQPRTLFYAQEFERLGAENIDVAGAFYRIIKNKIDKKAISKIISKADQTNSQQFSELRKTISLLQNTK